MIDLCEVENHGSNIIISNLDWKLSITFYFCWLVFTTIIYCTLLEWYSKCRSTELSLQCSACRAAFRFRPRQRPSWPDAFQAKGQSGKWPLLPRCELGLQVCWPEMRINCFTLRYGKFKIWYYLHPVSYLQLLFSTKEQSCGPKNSFLAAHWNKMTT